MGVDTVIFVRTTDGEDPDVDWMPDDCRVHPADYWSRPPRTATHLVATPWRYYDKHDSRGPWPDIAGVLMRLIAAPNVHCVWYGGDYSDTYPECSAGRVLELSRVYMEGL